MGTKLVLTILVGIIIQAACSIATAPPISGTQVSPASPLIPTETSVPITITATPVPSEITPEAPTAPSASAIPIATSPSPDAIASSGASTVKIFLIAINDNGVRGAKIGCGDSVVPLDVPITPTLGVLRAALTRLLSIKTRYFGGESDLYNSIYQSNLNIENLTLQDGVASIWLSGTLQLGGVCDAPRFQAQLEQTALQFSTVKQVNIFINGRPLSEVLSSK